MKVEGTRTFAADRQVVWSVLNDPARMAELMPGVESFDVLDDRHWVANVKIPLGLGGLRMTMSFDKVEEREPEYAKLDAKGNGVGAILSMQTSFHLEEVHAGTSMRWAADVSIAGPVGAMGQRVLQPIVNQQVGSVLTALDKQVQEAKGDGDGGGETSDPGFDPAPPEPAPTTPDADPVEGTSGADEGISPWAPETYESDPQGPTRSTED